MAADALLLEASYGHVLSKREVSQVERLLDVTRPPNDTSIASEQGSSRRLTLLDLQGLGKEIWAGEDAQDYVSALRAEWGD